MPIESKRARAGAHRGEQLHRAGELARLLGVAGQHEQLAHAHREQALEDLVEVRAVAHEARRQVRLHRVARADQRLGRPRRWRPGPCWARRSRSPSRPCRGARAPRPRCPPAAAPRSARCEAAPPGFALRSRVRAAIADISGYYLVSDGRRALQPHQRRGALEQVGGGARLHGAARPHRHAPAGARQRDPRGRADARAGDRPDAAARGGQAAGAREPRVGPAPPRDLRVGRGVRRHREHHRGARRAGGLRRRARGAADGGRVADRGRGPAAGGARS